jgi:hypothetical protein
MTSALQVYLNAYYLSQTYTIHSFWASLYHVGHLKLVLYAMSKHCSFARLSVTQKPLDVAHRLVFLPVGSRVRPRWAARNV